MTPIIVIEVEKPAAAGSDAGYVERLQRASAELKAQLLETQRQLQHFQESSGLGWLSAESAQQEITHLRGQLMELGRKNVALAAQAEQSDLLERQLEAADLRIDELEAALAVAQLPADSRDNVISMVRRAA